MRRVEPHREAGADEPRGLALPVPLPQGGGRCSKCIRTKAMFVAATGGTPELFIDNSFDEKLMLELPLGGREVAHILDLYAYAKDRGVVDQVPGLSPLVEECRRLNAMKRRGHDD